MSYLGLISYIILAFTVKMYSISNTKDFLQFNQTEQNSQFSFLLGFDLFNTFMAPTLGLIILNMSWISPFFFTWFGHLVVATMQHKILYWLLAWFFLVWCVQLTVFYFTSTELYDFFQVVFFFVLWLLLLFYSTNVFSFIFFIELLSIMIFLLLVSATFSSAYFFETAGHSRHSYFQQSQPSTYLSTLVFFFWTSLLGSVNLYVFLLFFGHQIATFDWQLTELVFRHLVVTGHFKELFQLSFKWLVFLFCLFLKCGLAPFFVWKPNFFKGIPIHALFVYVFFFYFFITLYFLYVLVVLAEEVFYFNVFVNFFLTSVGLVLLLFLLLESYYLKVFFALSSILNTLLVFLAISTANHTDFILLL